MDCGTFCTAYMFGNLCTCCNKCDSLVDDWILLLLSPKQLKVCLIEVLISHHPAFLSATKWNRSGGKGKGSESQVDHDLITWLKIILSCCMILFFSFGSQGIA